MGAKLCELLSNICSQVAHVTWMYRRVADGAKCRTTMHRKMFVPLLILYISVPNGVRKYFGCFCSGRAEDRKFLLAAEGFCVRVD